MRDNPAFKEIEMYILSSSCQTPEELLDMIDQLLTDTWLKEDMMSTAEMLIARGEARGRAEGKMEEKLTLRAGSKSSGCQWRKSARLPD
jgi:hypothetical protein